MDGNGAVDLDDPVAAVHPAVGLVMDALYRVVQKGNDLGKTLAHFDKPGEHQARQAGLVQKTGQAGPAPGLGGLVEGINLDLIGIGQPPQFAVVIVSEGGAQVGQGGVEIDQFETFFQVKGLDAQEGDLGDHPQASQVDPGGGKKLGLMGGVQFVDFTQTVDKADFFDMSGQNGGPGTGAVGAGPDVSGGGLQDDGAEIFESQSVPGQNLIDIFQAGTGLNPYQPVVPVHFEHPGHPIQADGLPRHIGDIRPGKGLAYGLEAFFVFHGPVDQCGDLFFVIRVVDLLRYPGTGAVPVTNPC